MEISVYQLDLEKEYFHHPANPNCSSLTYSVEIAAIRVNDQYIPFETPLLGDVEVNITAGLVAYVEPYIYESGTSDPTNGLATAKVKIPQSSGIILVGKPA